VNLITMAKGELFMIQKCYTIYNLRSTYGTADEIIANID
jgi:hypothetical protein